MNRKDFFAGMAMHALLERALNTEDGLALLDHAQADRITMAAWDMAERMEKDGPPADDVLHVDPPSPADLLERLEAIDRERKERER